MTRLEGGFGEVAVTYQEDDSQLDVVWWRDVTGQGKGDDCKSCLVAWRKRLAESQAQELGEKSLWVMVLSRKNYRSGYCPINSSIPHHY